MDIGTISLVLLIGIFVLLAIGMPLGFASGFLAVAVLMMKFGPDLLFRSFGTGPLNILAQRMYGLMTDYLSKTLGGGVLVCLSPQCPADATGGRLRAAPRAQRAAPSFLSAGRCPGRTRSLRGPRSGR